MAPPGELFDQDLTGGLLRPIRLTEEERNAPLLEPDRSDRDNWPDRMPDGPGPARPEPRRSPDPRPAERPPVHDRWTAHEYRPPARRPSPPPAPPVPPPPPVPQARRPEPAPDPRRTRAPEPRPADPRPAEPRPADPRSTGGRRSGPTGGPEARDPRRADRRSTGGTAAQPAPRARETDRRPPPSQIPRAPTGDRPRYRPPTPVAPTGERAWVQSRSRSEPPPPAAPAVRAAVPSQAESVGRSSAILAFGTTMSRVTGFVRVIAVLAVLGVSGVDDAYNYANSIPNIIFDLLLGGILSASLVPVFVEQLRNPDREEGDRGISAIFTVVGLALIVITAILFAAAPLVIHFYLVLKGHSTTAGDERAVGTHLLRLFAPQVFFLGGSVISVALLNARRQFGSAAFSPVCNNIVQIIAILATDAVAHSTNVAVFRHDSGAILVLGLGTTLGYVVELLVQVPAMLRTGIRFRFNFDLHHPAVRRVLGLSGWLIGVVIANQASLTVILVFAGKKTGDATAYQNAYQFFQLPYALFVVSVASALTPDLAERWAERDRRGFARRIITGMRVTLAFLTPAAVGYALLARPIISLAVQHGRVDAAGAHALSAALLGFVIGLPGYSAFVLLMRAYQAMQDTRTMFKLYAFENLLSLLLAYPFFHLFGVRGLALAWSIPYSIAAIAAAIGLNRRLGTLGGALTVRALWRVVVASAAMGIVLALVRSVLGPGVGDVGLIGRLIVEVGIGSLVFFIAARLLDIEEINPVLRLFKRLARR